MDEVAMTLEALAAMRNVKSRWYNRLAGTFRNRGTNMPSGSRR